MKPVLIKTNESELNSQLRQVNILRENLNNLYKSYLKLGLGQLTTDQLMPMVTDGKFVKCQLVSKIKDPSINGIKISKDKLMEMLEMPEGYDDFQNAKMILHEDHNYTGFGVSFFNIFSVQKKEVVINETELEKLRERFRVYAVTEDGINTLKTVREIIEKVNQLNSSGITGGRIKLEGQFFEGGSDFSNSPYLIRSEGIKNVDDIATKRANRGY